MKSDNRRLMWHGMFVFLLGLVTGLLEQRTSEVTTEIRTVRAVDPVVSRAAASIIAILSTNPSRTFSDGWTLVHRRLTAIIT